MKYYVFRKSSYTGYTEVLRTKCSDHWCSQKYLELHPEKVWQFSRQGARKIVERAVERANARGWAFEYWMEEAK